MISRIHIILYISVIFSVAANADDFMIHDVESGTAYGPFTYTNNAVITINDRHYAIRRANTATDLLIQKMKSIVIPRIEFREAHIRNVVAFMIEASEAADPTGQGVNIALSGIQDHKGSAQPEDIHGNGDSLEAIAKQASRISEKDIRISLKLKRVTLYDAISIVAELADLNYRIDERGVVFLDGKGVEIPIP